MPALLRLALDQIAAHRPDLLAVTGDLVDFPFYAMDDPGALAQGRRDLQLIRAILDQAPCPVAYLYGNHDHPASFRDVFADQALDRTAGDYRLLTFLDGEVRDNTAERLGESLTLFEAALADTDPRPQIHLQHYMVFPERDQGYPHSYREATALHEACAASGKVHLSLSGHFHRGENLQQHDGVHYATARAFCEAPHPFRVYELDGTTIAETEYYVETPAEGNRGLTQSPDQLVPVGIVEDIVDSGATLAYVQKILLSREPKSLRTACLLRKLNKYRSPIEINYVGFDIQDQFVVGYGLDYAEDYRNLPFIGIIKN